MNSRWMCLACLGRGRPSPPAWGSPCRARQTCRSSLHAGCHPHPACACAVILIIITGPENILQIRTACACVSSVLWSRKGHVTTLLSRDQIDLSYLGTEKLSLHPARLSAPWTTASSSGSSRQKYNTETLISFLMRLKKMKYWTDHQMVS